MFIRHLARLATSAVSVTLVHAGIQASPDVSDSGSQSIFSGEIGITVANQYITRGFVVQDDGTSFQPYLDLSANFYQADGFIRSASAFVSLWSAIGSTPYGDGGNRFTEFDYGPGLTVDFAERWTLTAFYNRWTSPAGAYDDGHWISLALELDDYGLIYENVALEPILQIAHEFGSDLAPGLCFEPGIRPNVTLFPESRAPVNVGLLIIAGLGSGYYGEDYGYFASGPQLSVSLGFIERSWASIDTEIETYVRHSPRQMPGLPSSSAPSPIPTDSSAASSSRCGAACRRPTIAPQ